MSDVHQVAFLLGRSLGAIRGRRELRIEGGRGCGWRNQQLEPRGQRHVPTPTSPAPFKLRRGYEWDASDHQLSTGLVGGEPQSFIPARRWVIGRQVRRLKGVTDQGYEIHSRRRRPP